MIFITNNVIATATSKEVKFVIFIMAQALVHTQGVVLGDKYFPLELSYCDVLGHEMHFLINSPLNYSKIRRSYPYAKPDALVTMTDGTSYSEVLSFLKQREKLIEKTLGGCTFGYKGNGYQTKVLDDAGITNRINLKMLPNLTYTGHCSWHKGNTSKCSRYALAQMLSHMTPLNPS